MLYLAHHEGFGGAGRLLRTDGTNGLKENETKDLFINQLNVGTRDSVQLTDSGKATINAYLSNNENKYSLAYKNWLLDYTDKKINIKDFTR